MGDFGGAGLKSLRADSTRHTYTCLNFVLAQGRQAWYDAGHGDFLSPTLLAVLFAVVAGTMVYISFDELLPMAERWGHHHLSIYGVTTGMLIMALVL